MKNSFIIAQEGFKFISIAFALFILFLIVDLEILSFISFLTIFALLWIYRNPERITPYYQDKSISSVCDGVVVSIDNLDNSEYFSEPCLRVAVESSCLDVSLFRAPFDSNLELLDFRNGTHLSLKKELSDKLNSRAVVKFSSLEENAIVCEHTLEYGFDSINIYSNITRVRESQRYGLMIKGRTYMYLPNSTRTSIKIGDDLKAGETLIGYFN